MADNYIALTVGSSRLSSTLLGTVMDLARDKARLVQLKNDMDNMTDGSDFTTLEEAFGIPTGKGQTVYNLIAGTVADFAASSDMDNLLNWMGSSI